MCVWESCSETKCISYSEQQSKKFENTNLEEDLSYLESNVRKH